MKPITREFEREIPNFKSHLEAKNWFKEKYGQDRFIMVGADIIDNKRIYFYNLILDSKKYHEKMKKIHETGGMDIGTELMNSYQPVEIWESGSIHIVH